MSTSINRRSFLKTSAAFAAAATVLPMTETIKPVWAQAPSDRLRMGCIGVGSMGRGDAHGFNHLCDIVAICDLDEDYGLGRTIRSGIGKKNEKGETITPDTYKDYRKVLERDDIDVVTVVTPDHWHVKIAVEALQAGKHVFCQKPLTLTLEENKIIRKAVEKYGKTFQVGTQQRSQYNEFAKAALIVRAGMLGDIKKLVVDIARGHVLDACQLYVRIRKELGGGHVDHGIKHRKADQQQDDYVEDLEHPSACRNPDAAGTPFCHFHTRSSHHHRLVSL